MGADLYEFPEQHKASQRARSGEPPYDGGMEARITRLEGAAQEMRDRLTRIETRLEAVATREDLHKAISEQTWKVIGAVIALGTALSGIVFFIARNVH